MNKKNIDFLKRNGISFANLIILLGMFWSMSAWVQKAEDDINFLKTEASSPTKHPTVEENMRIFITRNEYNELGKKIDMINQKVDLLLNKSIK